MMKKKHLCQNKVLERGKNKIECKYPLVLFSTSQSCITNRKQLHNIHRYYESIKVIL